MRIGNMLRMLPESVFESTAHVNKILLEQPLVSSSTAQEQLDASLRNPQNIHYEHERPQQESPINAHLTITFEISTQIKKSFKANRKMEKLLVKSADEFRRLEYDLDFLFNDLDCLCLFLCDLLSDQTMPSAPRVHYTRLTPGGQQHRQCILVRWISHTILNGDGQVMEVSIHYHFSNCRTSRQLR